MNEHRATFPKRARLRKRQDYVRIQREGRRRHTEHFVILVANGAADRARVGITVSARIGNAVLRNRIKRLVREVMRTLRQQLRPADIVVIAKPGAGIVTHAAASSEIRRGLLGS